jgi:5-methyltetrahydrofolate--homocysteine methyltransferase
MKYTFLDGATGTNLMKAGMPKGVCVEKWVLENPQVITDLQRKYVESGSDIIYSPTFGANPVTLGKYGLEEKTEEMNKSLVALSKKAAGNKAKVAGDISSTGLLMAPMGDATYEQIKNAYMRQARALDQAGVDLFILETFSSLGECLAAFDGVRAVSDKDIAVSVTVENSGKTLCGDTPAACLVALEARGACAFGVNCSSGVESMAKIIGELSKISKIPLISKPNAGLPTLVDGENVFPDSPESFAEKYISLSEAGASFVGGCCGTTPEHIKALHDKLADREPVESCNKCIYVCSNNDVFSLGDVVYPERVACDDDVLFSIPEKDEADFFRLYIENEEQLDSFVECMSSIETPLILGAETIELFEKAVALYVGRCIYDGECGFDGESLEKLQKKYGFIVL